MTYSTAAICESLRTVRVMASSWKGREDDGIAQFGSPIATSYNLMCTFTLQGFIQGGGGAPWDFPPQLEFPPPKFENCYVIIAYTWSKTAVER